MCAWDRCPMLAPRCCGTSVPYTHSADLSIHAYGAGDAVSDEGEGGGEVSEEERSEKEGSDGNKDNEIEEERGNNFFNCLLAKLLSFHEASSRAVRSNKDNG